MVHKVLFWSCYGSLSSFDSFLFHAHSPSGAGLAVRWLQLGIEKRPFFNKESLWVWPLFASIGGSFGYWLKGVGDRQMDILAERRESLLDKRRRKAERDAAANGTKTEGGVTVPSES